jgi:site-specific DNA recombinase
MKRKVVAYIRVSTEEQATKGYSIESQRQILKDYAIGHDLHIVQEFVEAESAYKPGRPEFSKMLKLLQKQREVTGVLCYKLDRLARNMQDYAVIEEMQGIAIISATEALPTGATGRFVGSIHAAVSRYYSDQLGERVRLALRTKATKGLWPAAAPTGYIKRPDQRIIEPDQEMGPIIKHLFETYARGGVSLSALVALAQEMGLRTKKGGSLGKSALHKLMTNPIYHGTVRWDNNSYEGLHEPLVSTDLFNEVGRRLRGGSVPLTRRSFPFRGLLECGYCGCRITASLEKKRYVYYHCTRSKGRCEQSFIREERLSDLLRSVIDSVHLTKEQVTDLMRLIRADTDKRRDAAEKRVRELKEEVVALQRRRDAVYEDKLDAKIDEARWLEMEQRWSLDTERLERQIRLLEKGEPQLLVDELQSTFELLERAPRLYLRQSDEERARLLNALASNCVIRGEKIDPIYRNPFDLVAEGVRRSDWYARQDSNL